MAQSTQPATQSVGFLTIVRDNTAYLGGYLVTNLWGRPLEFRLSTAVQPNRIQQILYGSTLQPYICADLIGKTLIEKTTTGVQGIITDCEPVLELRLRIEVPIACLRIESSQLQVPTSNSEPGMGNTKWPVLSHPLFPADVEVVRNLLDRLDGVLELAEPFERIREAMNEARKLGVTSRN